MKIIAQASLTNFPIFVLFLVPLLIYPFFSEYNDEWRFIDFFYLNSCILLIGIGYFIDQVRFKYKLNFNKVDIMIFSLLTYLVGNCFFKANALQNSIVALNFFLLYIFFKTYFSNKGLLKMFLKMTLILGVITQLIALLQFCSIIKSNSLFFSITSFFPNPGPLSGYLLMVMPIAIYLKDYGNFLKFIAITFLIFCVIIFIVTQSRAAIIGSIAILFLFPNSLKNIKFIFKSNIAKALVVVSCLFIFYSLYKLKEDSVSGRLFIWKVSSSMLKLQPLFGNGMGFFSSNYNNYQSAYFSAVERSLYEQQIADLIFNPFNEPLRIVIENGVIGLLLFLALPIYLLNKLLQKSCSDIFQHCAISVLCVFLFSLFSYPLSVTYIQILLCAFLAILSSQIQGTDLGVNSKKIFFIVSIVSLIVCGGVNIQKYLVFNNWLKLKQHLAFKIQTGFFVQQEKKLFSKLKWNDLFLVEHGTRLLEVQQYENSVKVLTLALQIKPHPTTCQLLANGYDKLGKFYLAELMYYKAINMVPNRYNSRFKLFLFYKRHKNYKKMRIIGMQILNMPEKIRLQEVDLIKEIIRNQLD